jgi:hypothetical protein
VSPPRRRPPPPEFFVDRSLGRYAVPDAVRAVGYEVHTLASVYGEQEGQSVDDVTWLREAGRRNWVVLLKDDRVRRRPAERDALIDARLRVFCLTNAGLRGGGAGTEVHHQHQPDRPASGEAGTIRLRRL